MAFNPYEVRPIGSSKFEEHLKDIYVSKYYQNMLPVEESDVQKLAPYGQKMWHSEQEHDPLEDLIFAVTAQAVVDYINYYAAWRNAQQEENREWENLYHSVMLRIENEYFRQNAYVEPVFDKLLDMLQEQHRKKKMTKAYANKLIAQVRHNYLIFCDEHEMMKGVVKK